MTDDTYRTASGRVLSDEEIEALSEEAERGYEIRDLVRVDNGNYAVYMLRSTLVRSLESTVEKEDMSDADAHVLGIIISSLRSGIAVRLS